MAAPIARAMARYNGPCARSMSAAQPAMIVRVATASRPSCVAGCYGAAGPAAIGWRLMVVTQGVGGSLDTAATQPAE